MSVANPFDDTSPFTLLGSRFETPAVIRDGLNAMVEEWVNSLPADDPARLLWAVLPKPPQPGDTRDADELAADLAAFTGVLSEFTQEADQ